MNRPRGIAFVLVAAVVAAGVAFAGEVRRGPARRIGGEPRVTHPDALRKVGACEELRSFLIDLSVERLVEHLYLWRWIVPWSSPGGVETFGGQSPLDYSTTNVQEQGVDELDLVKTDGHHLYVTSGGSLRVVRAWPPAEASEVAEVPIGSWAGGLFLYGGRALTATADEVYGAFQPPHMRSDTRLQVVNVSDPAAPVVERTLELEGWLLDARRIEGDVYVVVHSQISEPPEVWALLDDEELELPELPEDPTWEDRLAAAEAARPILRPRVADIIAKLPDAVLVPHLRDRVTGRDEEGLVPLVQCDQLMIDDSSPWMVFTSIVHLDLAAGDPPGGDLSAAGVVAGVSTVYASGSTLYLVEPGWARASAFDEPEHESVIHAFDLDPAGDLPVRYAAAGVVPGYVYDQFALSEHDGFLRVATDVDWWRNPGAGSRVTVLARRGGDLVEVGALDGIAPGEQLYAVRFLGDLGFLVTFRQIDPLFTLDLADPEAPSIIGELEVSGYSSYLHPVGDDRLLALGVEADPDAGRVEGLAVSWFDLGDLADPRLEDRLVFTGEEWSWSEALYDHHAITYHRGVLSFPRYRYTAEHGYETTLAVIDAAPGEPLRHLGDIRHDDLWPDNFYNRMLRSVVIEDWLYSISEAGIKVTPLRDPEEVVATVSFTR